MGGGVKSIDVATSTDDLREATTSGSNPTPAECFEATSNRLGCVISDVFPSPRNRRKRSIVIVSADRAHAPVHQIDQTDEPHEEVGISPVASTDNCDRSMPVKSFAHALSNSSSKPGTSHKSTGTPILTRKVEFSSKNLILFNVPENQEASLPLKEAEDVKRVG